ncbi:hypothetical protein HK103_003410 [Boothiomyces macroporosus]|uniref:Protein-tyrosine-phosphatase n=1 Tax=Boothiomyces macroporosus TaxID=261099 RepID=A0AAD5UIQ8_9FUNG|nr:hypothetical protein HK103_003410 [Boothiomyces macroporosus]
MSLFYDCSLKINEIVNQGGRVLVHCLGGISRAPAFVIAYLMDLRNIDYEEAFALVQDVRYCINPIENFKVQLREYQYVVRARSQNQIGIQREKRALDEEERFQSNVLYINLE